MQIINLEPYSELKTLLDMTAKYDLKLVPLHSVQPNGYCTCGSQTCSSVGKHPLLRISWQKIATGDKTTIMGWAKQSKHGHINYGLATGRLSSKTNKYLIVVDVDATTHEIYDRLPKTFSYRTGSGGMHFWYWHNEPLANSVSLVAPSVDIRGKNGYAIVPPSQHASGSTYQITCQAPIADLPKFIVEATKVPVAKPQTSCTRVIKSAKPCAGLVALWSLMPVSKIREQLEAGVKIPVGVRNKVIYRLLASDRALGAASITQLLNCAIDYALCVEQPASFQTHELKIIVNSVMKFTPGNFSHERVNDIYFKWMQRNGKTITPDIQKEIVSADEQFFDSLEASTQHYVSLAEIAQARSRLMLRNTWSSFASYKPCLLGQKLRDLGFKRVRTSKHNLWAINLSKVEGLIAATNISKQPANTSKAPAALNCGAIKEKQPMSFYARNFFTNAPVEYSIRPYSETVFVSDFYATDLQGGAEMTTEAILAKAPDPHLSRLHTSSIDYPLLALHGQHRKLYWIFGNATQLDHRLLAELSNMGIKYSIVEYDFKFCQFRSMGRHKKETGKDCNCIKTPYGLFWKDYYMGAKNLFWMSEKQRDIYVGLMPELKDKNNVVLSSVFSDEDFNAICAIREKAEPKLAKSAMLGDGSWIKGIEPTEAYLKQLGVPYDKLGNMSHEQFMKKLAQYEQFVFMPADFDTCPRVTIEAKLLGCKLLLNEHVLHQNESWFMQQPADIETYLKTRPEVFWKHIKNT